MKRRCGLVILLAFFVAAVGPPVSAQQSSGARIALLIGNADYPDADAPLRQPVPDARALADELRRNGFEAEVAENLTKEAMQHTFERLYGQVKAGSTVLLFFSGYAIQTGRQTYLVPVNAQIWTEGEVRRGGLGIDAILAELNARGAAVKLAIIDASRRNPFERRFRSVSSGIAPISAPPGTLVMSAAAPGVVINDGDGENSLFMRELLKEMRSPGPTIEEMFNHTRIGVSRVSKGEQVPWISSSLMEDVYLGKGPALVERKPQPDVQPQGGPARGADPEAQRDFDFAARLGTKQAWQDFLHRHGSGPYADQARERLNSSGTVAKQSSQAQTESKPQPAAKPESKPEPKVETARIDDPLIQELSEHIDKNPKDGDVYFKRGFAYAQKGRYAEAIKDFDQVIRLNPKDSEAFNNRCWARAKLGELKLALRDCNESLRLRPNYADALDSRGLVNLKMDLPKSAISDYDAALRLNPKHASALYGRGKAKLRRGDTAGGDADIQAAKAIDPDIEREFDAQDGK